MRRDPIKCPKCGRDNWSPKRFATYHSKKDEFCDFTSLEGYDEHLHGKCLGCGYAGLQFLFRTLDRPPMGKLPSGD